MTLRPEGKIRGRRVAHRPTQGGGKELVYLDDEGGRPLPEPVSAEARRRPRRTAPAVTPTPSKDGDA